MSIWENIPQKTKDDLVKSLGKFDRLYKRKQKIKKIIYGNRKEI